MMPRLHVLHSFHSCCIFLAANFFQIFKDFELLLDSYWTHKNNNLVKLHLLSIFLCYKYPENSFLLDSKPCKVLNRPLIPIFLLLFTKVGQRVADHPFSHKMALTRVPVFPAKKFVFMVHCLVVFLDLFPSWQEAL